MSFEQQNSFEYREPTKNELLLEGFQSQLDAVAKNFRARGIQNCQVQKNRVVVDYSQTLFAVPVSYFDARKDEECVAWICGSPLEDKMAYTIPEFRNFDMGSTEISKHAEKHWLQEASESTKIVKSRPMFMYPEQFDLEPEEVWPRNSDIMVIGDPYQSCDRERYTIIEYEYADEMIPPVLKWKLEGLVEQEIFERARSWFRNQFFEDIRGAERGHGRWSVSGGSPYARVSDMALDLAAQMYTKTVLGADEHDFTRMKLAASEFKYLLEKLRNGLWSIADVAHYFRDYEQENVVEMFHQKEEIRGKVGDPRMWEDFVERWNNYLAKVLPLNVIRLPDLDKRVAQARYWIKELPTAKSPQRVNEGLYYLNELYFNFMQFYNKEIPENTAIYDDSIADATDTGLMASGAFGAYIPGKVLDMRTTKLLENVRYVIESAEKYMQEVAPKLQYIEEGLSRAPLSPEIKYHVLRTYEHPLLNNYLMQKRAKKAVPLHGFFPYQMPPGVEKQDRIVALTSVTMHGWNHLSEPGFYEDISTAIDYLKLGGKYILGPVNQYVHFGGYESDFDSKGLCEALEKLAAEGKITFEFHGKSEMKGYKNDDEDSEVDMAAEDSMQMLRVNQSAASLVITRIK